MLCWLQPQPQTQINGILMVVAIPTRCFSFGTVARREAYDRVGSPVKAAEIRAKAEKRSRQPQVQLNKNFLHTFVKRKMKKVKESKHMVQIKQERRDQAFEKFKSDKLDAATIYKKIDQMEKDDEQLELNDLEARLFGIEISS